MCTIVVASRVFADAPLLVAANRDEAFARPAQGPALRRFRADGPRVLAPIDLQAKGTWAGVNRHAIFVALTNRHGRPPEATRASRGALVARYLEATNLAEAWAWAQEELVDRYNGFHLLVASPDAGFVLWNDEDRRRVYKLPPGVHVLTERFAGSEAGVGSQSVPTQRPERALALAQSGWLGRPGAPDDEALQRLLSDQDGLGFEDLRVVSDDGAYGTRSALTLRLPGDGAHRGAASFTWSEGPPRQGSFVDRSDLLVDLFA